MTKILSETGLVLSMLILSACDKTPASLLDLPSKEAQGRCHPLHEDWRLGVWLRNSLDWISGFFIESTQRLEKETRRDSFGTFGSALDVS